MMLGGGTSALWQNLRALLRQAAHTLRDVIRLIRANGPSQFQFWFIALGVGIAAGFAAVFFRKGITALQSWIYGAPDVQRIHTFAADLHWMWLLMPPVIGGLIVGLILDNFTDDGRVRSVADVIEGAAMNEGRVERRAGLASAAASRIASRSSSSL